MLRPFHYQIALSKEPEIESTAIYVFIEAYSTIYIYMRVYLYITNVCIYMYICTGIHI